MTLRAAVTGVIDFRDAAITDPSWWRRCNLLLRSLDRMAQLQVLEAAYTYQCNIATAPDIDAEAFKQSQQEARTTFQAIAGLLQPWKSVEDNKAKKFTELIDDYKDQFGDPASPEFQARERENYRRFLENERAAQGESAEQRVDRLISERNAKYQRVRDRRP